MSLCNMILKYTDRVRQKGRFIPGKVRYTGKQSESGKGFQKSRGKTARSKKQARSYTKRLTMSESYETRRLGRGL